MVDDLCKRIFFSFLPAPIQRPIAIRPALTPHLFRCTLTIDLKIGNIQIDQGAKRAKVALLHSVRNSFCFSCARSIPLSTLPRYSRASRRASANFVDGYLPRLTCFRFPSLGLVNDRKNLLDPDGAITMPNPRHTD